MTRAASTGRRLRIALVLGAALAIGAAASLAITWAADSEGRVPRPVISVDDSTQCVASAETMRRTHMRLLGHQRDRTVRDGVRGEPVSLNACVACHAGPGAGTAAGSAIGSAQAFCESCHRYAAVKIDCFECHQPRPAAAAQARAENVR